MNIFGILKKTTQKKKSSSLDLRKTQSSPVIIIRNTPTNLKPILTNYSNLTPPPPTSQDETLADDKPPPPPKPQDDTLAERLRVISADDMELLLSMETQARMDHQAEQEERQLEQQTHHPKRLTFALPEPLSGKRWSLPEDAIQQDLKKKKATKWSRCLTGHKSDPSAVHPQQQQQQQQQHLHYGCKVKLIRSPIKTTAYVRYIGPVHFAPGEWIGVELERAVGKTDGSVEGQRYFYTGAYRGSFFTKDELMLA
ncbi:CAP Gly-rich domain-containing protein [Chlamydoabsidia padenii]|nr:CAP Gly-rich domain-containing protein [Chlamydoabsidia padenii]